MGCPTPPPPHHRQGRFANPGVAEVTAPLWKVFWWLLTRPRLDFFGRSHAPGEYPPHAPPSGDVRAFYVGHASIIFETAGMRVLTDPILSETCSPVPSFGTRRYRPAGITHEAMPEIDVVLISHNHYDHLDKATIRKLGNKPHYIVPLGLAPWFRRLGIERVTELDWWESKAIGPLTITATPCQHWSKRTPFDYCKSLWCGYSVATEQLRFLFIGDSGYCGAFREIGKKLGPFQLAAMPIGGYEPSWVMKKVHMNPEEALQAFLDVDAQVLIPTHYNAFHLTDEPIVDPPRRLYRAWLAAGLELDHLWMLAPGQHRCLEDIIHIPTVRAVGARHSAESSAAIRTAGATGGELTDWGIAVCPHMGDMIDLEVAGHRDHIFKGDEGKTLTLDVVRCSAHGDLPECSSRLCPLRDPAFLRSYRIDGIEADGRRETFVEFDSPPSPNWWRDEMVLERKLEA